MAAPPIQVQLSKFEQIEILRTEIELREQELKNTEKHIRQTLWEVERQKYLQTVHPIFAQLPQPETVAQMPQLTANRDALSEAVEAMKAVLTKLETETAGMTAPPPRGLSAARGGAASPLGGGLPRKAKFDSF